MFLWFQTPLAAYLVWSGWSAPLDWREERHAIHQRIQFEAAAQAPAPSLWHSPAAACCSEPGPESETERVSGVLRRAGGEVQCGSFTCSWFMVTLRVSSRSLFRLTSSFRSYCRKKSAPSLSCSKLCQSLFLFEPASKPACVPQNIELEELVICFNN